MAGYDIKMIVKTDRLIRAFARAPKEVAQILRVEMKKQLAEVQNKARVGHRFVTRTGMLEKSVSKDVDTSGLIGIVSLNVAIASYGPYVHEGQRSWAPDRFLYKAFNMQKSAIFRAMKIAVKRALRQVGLGG